jgi:FtsP/CotA-like multicopper oxidase with cupredoxin domain
LNKIQRAILSAAVAGGLAWVSSASAQVPFTSLNSNPRAANAAFPRQNPAGPGGTNYQVNYPYPGQCLASSADAALFPGLPRCDGQSSTSFSCENQSAGVSQRSAGGWAGCGAPSSYPFRLLSPIAPDTTTPKFVWEVLNPPDYTPDQARYPGADYYEIGLHESFGFQALASAGLFPNPPAGRPVPNGMQWTGLTCNVTGGCTCPHDASASFRSTHCTSGGKIPVGAPLFTPIWGIGQINMGGGPVTQVLSSLGLFAAGPSSSWSPNNYVATWPSISIRGTKGRPVVVKWVNEFPNNHVLCPHPEAADWPCAIDRTFMGVKTRIDPALASGSNVPPDGVNQYGSPQQPDNSWVTHLHGGEIPPSTDGFAEKWFGNANTAAKYNGVAQNHVMPPFENPTNIALKRPQGNADVYSYPMVQEEATIWFHDHTLGKTHHNVIAGPAGFFPVKDPARHGAVSGWNGASPLPASAAYTWLDPVTEPRDGLGIPKYDLFFAVQDRAFNDDGSINFSNGLGQTPLPPPPVDVGVVGQTPVTPGVNPLVHPTWVPEYFGDHALVNGVLWPKKSVETGWYRIRFANGSDSRCYTAGLQVVRNRNGQPGPAPAPDAAPAPNLAFYVIANDQGYLQRPVRTRTFTMCPGERYELLVDFGNLGNGVNAFGDATVYLTNAAPAPFPAGFPPFQTALGPSPFPHMNVLMRFDVRGANGPGIRFCGAAGAPRRLTWDPAQPVATNLATACMPSDPTRVVDPTYVDLRRAALPPGQAAPIVRQVYLNERVDGVTLAPMGMQLNGVPFEYKVTETPNFGTREVWQFINLTVDTHPMHPHLVRHQIVSRQNLDVAGYKTDLCGSATCQPGPTPGNEMQVVPNVNGLSSLGLPFLVGALVPVGNGSVEGGYKDVVQVPPGMVTTIVADWAPRWSGASAGTTTNPVGRPNAPGSAGCPSGQGCAAPPWTYEAVTAGPYVWHCHINSHEDSEMMRTSLVVP